MAKPILRTPELDGSDAERFAKLHAQPTLSASDRAILQSCVETYQKNKK